MMHDGTWHERQWERIESEYNEPVQDVVADYYYRMHIPMCHLACILYVSEATLRHWFRKWNWATQRRGYEKTPVEGKVMRRAQELGYRDIRSAIGAMRAEGRQWIEIRAILGCSDGTLCRHYPDSARGYYYLSDAGREAKAAHARILNARMASGEVRRGGYKDCPLCYVVPLGRIS